MSQTDQTGRSTDPEVPTVASDYPQVPDVPAVDGPFVEVTPGAWVRAAAILAVEDYTDHDWHELEDTPPSLRRREYVACVIVAGGGGDHSARWRSPYPSEQLRTACRLADHREDLRRLDAAARLVARHTRRDDRR